MNEIGNLVDNICYWVVVIDFEILIALMFYRANSVDDPLTRAMIKHLYLG